MRRGTAIRHGVAPLYDVGPKSWRPSFVIPWYEIERWLLIQRDQEQEGPPSLSAGGPGCAWLLRRFSVIVPTSDPTDSNSPCHESSHRGLGAP
jgi:hypothetical protein